MSKQTSSRDNSRSRGFEERIKAELEVQGVSFSFEPFFVPYQKECHYLPDIVLPNGIIVEVKGWFKSADRTKHKLIREQHPELDIRFVFRNANNRIGKKSNTTYGKWCRMFGFQYAVNHIPLGWFDEPPKFIPEKFQKRNQNDEKKH